MLSKFLRFLAIFLLVPLLLAAAWLWLTLTWSYSEGERAGYVQKLSKKGWICKSWEGEIAMVSMPGAIPEKFEFSVRDEAVAEKINAMAGKKVVLVYKQHKFVPSNCFGETEYFIADVREVREGAAPAAVAPAAVLPPAVAPAAVPGPAPALASVPAPVPVPVASAPAK
jgi:hypothetical protein